MKPTNAVTPAGNGPRRAVVPGPAPDVEPYADEMVKINEVGVILNNKFRNKRFSEKIMIEFTQACQEMYANIGFLVGVDWYQAVIPSTGESQTIPRVLIQGRVTPLEETDHDRVRHDIVTGKADGVAGYVREDGSKHEDPIKRIIT